MMLNTERNASLFVGKSYPFFIPDFMMPKYSTVVHSLRKCKWGGEGGRLRFSMYLKIFSAE